MSNMDHLGFISSIRYDDLTEWYETIENNEIINFLDSNGSRRQLNSLTIFTESTGLRIRLLPTDFCIYIPPNSYLNIDKFKIERIQVMKNAGTKLRWYGLFF